MAKDARLEFTCTEWGCVIPAHDSPIAVRPRTQKDADNMLLVLRGVTAHMEMVRAKLPKSSDITSEPASQNQIVELKGVAMNAAAQLVR